MLNLFCMIYFVLLLQSEKKKTNVTNGCENVTWGALFNFLWVVNYLYMCFVSLIEDLSRREFINTCRTQLMDLDTWGPILFSLFHYPGKLGY